MRTTRRRDAPSLHVRAARYCADMYFCGERLSEAGAQSTGETLTSAHLLNYSVTNLAAFVYALCLFISHPPPA